MTTEEPMVCERCGQAHGRCKGHNRRGGSCGLWPMRGQLVCGMHGGKSPGARENAEQRRVAAAAEKELRRLWDGEVDPIKDPVAALAKLAGALGHMTSVVGDRVNELRSVAGGEHLTQLRAEVQLLSSLLARSDSVLTNMARLNLGQRQVEVEEWQGQMLGHALVAALGEITELGPELRDRVIRGVLGRLGCGPELLEVPGASRNPTSSEVVVGEVEG